MHKRLIQQFGFLRLALNTRIHLSSGYLFMGVYQCHGQWKGILPWKRRWITRKSTLQPDLKYIGLTLKSLNWGNHFPKFYKVVAFENLFHCYSYQRITVLLSCRDGAEGSNIFYHIINQIFDLHAGAWASCPLPGNLFICLIWFFTSYQQFFS